MTNAFSMSHLFQASGVAPVLSTLQMMDVIVVVVLTTLIVMIVHKRFMDVTKMRYAMILECVLVLVFLRLGYATHKATMQTTVVIVIVVPMILIAILKQAPKIVCVHTCIVRQMGTVLVNAMVLLSLITLSIQQKEALSISNNQNQLQKIFLVYLNQSCQPNASKGMKVVCVKSPQIGNAQPTFIIQMMDVIVIVVLGIRIVMILIPKFLDAWLMKVSVLMENMVQLVKSSF